MNSRAWNVAICFLHKNSHSLLSAADDHIEKLNAWWEMLVYSLQLYYFQKQKYGHCEIAFPNSKDLNLVDAYTMYEKTGCTKTTRSFSSGEYIFICLGVDDEKAKMMKDFCDKCVKKGNNNKSAVPYDVWGVGLHTIWISKNPKKYWCTSFVVCVLKILGYFKDELCGKFTIDEVYDRLIFSKDRVIAEITTKHTQDLISKKLNTTP